MTSKGLTGKYHFTEFGVKWDLAGNAIRISLSLYSMRMGTATGENLSGSFEHEGNEPEGNAGRMGDIPHLWSDSQFLAEMTGQYQRKESKAVVQ